MVQFEQIDEVADLPLDIRAGGIALSMVINTGLPNRIDDVHRLISDVTACLEPAERISETVISYGVLRALHVAHEYPEVFGS